MLEGLKTIRFTLDILKKEMYLVKGLKIKKMDLLLSLQLITSL